MRGLASLIVFCIIPVVVLMHTSYRFGQKAKHNEIRAESAADLEREKNKLIETANALTSISTRYHAQAARLEAKNNELNQKIIEYVSADDGSDCIPIIDHDGLLILDEAAESANQY